jgi:hypothetical protein
MGVHLKLFLNSNLSKKIWFFEINFFYLNYIKFYICQMPFNFKTFLKSWIKKQMLLKAL